MERFVGLIVAGGLALIGGLWAIAFSAAWTGVWLAGVVLAGLGIVGLSAGIASELEFRG